MIYDKTWAKKLRKARYCGNDDINTHALSMASDLFWIETYNRQLAHTEFEP